jgi:phi13 family phage major tail protein
VKALATVGLDSLYYQKITEDSQGQETYGTPHILAKAMEADLSIELIEESLYADDGACYTIKEFKSGTLKLSVADLSPEVVADLSGAVIDDNGVLISSSEDGGDTVAVGFRARRPEGDFRLFWVYKIKFGAPSVKLVTKGNKIEFQTPALEGIVMRRNRPDALGKHPWKCEVIEGATGVPASVIATWFEQVYEAALEAPSQGG